jgi:hypothetical protein
MPLYTPNAVTLAPPDLNWDGSFYVTSAIAHPVLPIVPRRVETLPPLRPGIAGSWMSPPALVIAAMWTKRWRVQASITGKSASFTVDEEVTWADGNWKSAMGYASSRSIYSETQSPPVHADNNAFIAINHYPDEVFYARTTGLWWPGITVWVWEENYDDVPSEFADAQIGFPGAGSGLGDSAITLTIAGETITMRKFYDDFALTGSITLTPLAPLDIA